MRIIHRSRNAGLVWSGLLAAVLAAHASTASGAILLVWQKSPRSAPPYATWGTAATNIQDAIDSAKAGDEIVVTNGVYVTGGQAVVETMTNRVAVTKPLIVRSVNGPSVTLIVGHPPGAGWNGDGAVRCAYVGTGSVLSGFTLTNGHSQTAGDYWTKLGGGGVWCEINAIVSNCVIVGNSAVIGGGAYSGNLLDCLLIGNSASGGGGAFSGTLFDCVLTSNAALHSGGGARLSTLSGCRISGNSATNYGGGVYECIVANCKITGNAAGDTGGGIFAGQATNSKVSGNSAAFGGGVAGGSLHHCEVTSNSALLHGGGAWAAWLHKCTINQNRAGSEAGGAYSGFLFNCVIRGNLAETSGGGASFAVLQDCIVSRNSVSLQIGFGGGVSSCSATRCQLAENRASSGGGAYSSTLHNCLLTANSATRFGGGAFYGDSYQCTLAGNVAGEGGGGAGQGWLRNSIAYYNHAPDGSNWSGSSLSYCCTLPLPPGPGNITNEPSFLAPGAGDYHLHPDSPCVDAGTNLSATVANDLDGNPRPLDGNRDSSAAFDMGTYEFNGLFLTSITRVGENVRVCWFDNVPGMMLQTAPSLPPDEWTGFELPPDTNCMEFPAAGTNAIFRLVVP